MEDLSIKLRVGDVVRVLSEDGLPIEKGAVVEKKELDTYLVECEDSGLRPVKRSLLRLVRPI